MPDVQPLLSDQACISASALAGLSPRRGAATAAAGKRLALQEQIQTAVPAEEDEFEDVPNDELGSYTAADALSVPQPAPKVMIDLT